MRSWRTTQPSGLIPEDHAVVKCLKGDWCAVQPVGAATKSISRCSDDGVLMVVQVRVQGKTAQALVDSGASRSFVRPEAVIRLGLHTVTDQCVLELADGRHILSSGKVPHTLVTVASASARLDLTVTPLLKDVDIILGTNWLAAVNPLIDWATGRIVFPDAIGTSSIVGQWLPSEQKTGQVAVISHSGDGFFLPPSRLLHPQCGVLAAPSFWRYASSSHAWTRASPPGGVACAMTSSTEKKQPDVTTPSPAVSKIRTTVQVQGRRCTQVKSKASGQRQLLSAKQMNKLAKRGETVFLAVVRHTGEMRRKQGRLSAVKSHRAQLQKEGPKRDFATVEQRRDEILAKVAEKDRQSLKEILVEFQDVFPEQLPGGRPPKRAVELEIREEPGSTPPSRAPYRLSPKEQEELEVQLKDLLDHQFIRPSVSPYGAPILFVPKKDGRWRLCIDYRALNKQTVKDRFPLPRIDELLERLGGARVFSALDLASGYHQIGVAESSIEKTAFRTSRGSWEFIVMPFGLTNAPSVFQRLMNKIFKDVLGDFVLVYLDDILIFSRSVEEHWGHLRVALQRLREAKLYGRLHKCDFLKDKVEYLGFDVSAQGMQPSRSKVAAILDWPVPESVRDVRSFLGTVSFYRRFVRGFSAMAFPLTELTKEKKPWQWTEEEQQSFDQLKVAITTSPVLIFPDFKKQFVLTTDASLVSVGGILQQDHGLGLQPIAYGSKKLNTAEVRYSAYERELLGIIWAIGQWRPYLQGQRFIVQTDHSALKFLPDQPAVHRRVWKWISILQGYDVDIRHIPGRRNPADGLSRRQWKQDNRINQAAKQEESRLFRVLQLGENPSDEDIQAALDKLFIERPTEVSVQGPVQLSGIRGSTQSQFSDQAPAQLLVTRTTVDVSNDLRQKMFQQLQQESPYREIITELEDAPIIRQEVKRGVETYRFRHSTLVVHRPDFHEDEPYWKFVVPDNIDTKAAIFKELHDLPTGGHPGFNRTLQAARRRFYWRGMTTDVREYVLQCPVCQVEKGETSLPRGELQPLRIPTQRWSEVTIDFVTKLPKTETGYDSVFVAVDRATKMVHLVPCVEAISAKETAQMFWHHVVRLHGVPKCLYSDRDRRFESAFWKYLWRLLGSDLRFSTAYHPQTQGQVERMNAVFEQVLRCTVHELGERRDWDTLLTHVEFCLNSQPNRSTGYSPFYLTYGYHPTTPIDLLSATDTSSVEGVTRFAQRLRQTYATAQEHLHRANEAYKKQYDRRHRPATFAVGDAVLLSTRNLRMKGTPAKLQRRYVGPYRVVERVGERAYRLRLPDGWNIHPVFHVSLLKPWKTGAWEREEPEVEPELEPQVDDREYEIEKLLRWRPVRVGNQRSREFLVLYKGYGLDDASWVREQDIRPQSNVQIMIDEDRPVRDDGGSSSS